MWFGVPPSSSPFPFLKPGFRNDDVFVYYDVGVGDGLDGLDGTPQKAEENRQRYQGQLRAFNAKRANQQGSLVETNSGRVSDAPFKDGEGNASLRSSNGGGGSDSTNKTVGSGHESAPALLFSQDGGEGTDGGRDGESAPPSLALFYFSPTSDSGEGVV